MPGLLDFLFSGGGGGLLGGIGQQPMQISPPAQQNGMMGGQMSGQMGGYPGGMDPLQYALKAMQPDQSSGLLFDANSGFMGNMKNALDQIGNPGGADKRQQQAIQNYIALKQLGMQEKAAEEKPQVIKAPDPRTGMERPVLVQPFGRGASWLDINDPSGAATSSAPPFNLPPGADVKTYREKIAADAAANEQDSVKSAKAAAELQPLVDQMITAYDRAHKAGAIGPIAASTPMRANEKYNPVMSVLGNPEREKARQDYELAKAAVQARITAAQNKGEGQVSNFERQLYAAQFPDLTAVEPTKGLEYLRQLQASTRQTVEAGKVPALGQAPQVGAVLNRPAVGGPAATQSGPQAGGDPLADARAAIAKGAPRDAVINRLIQNKINPAGL